MKKIIYSIFAMLTLFITKVSLALDIQGELNNVTNPSDISSVGGTNGTSMLVNLLNWFKEELLSVVEVVVIGVLIWLGFKMIMARGNPEEFKKAWIWFVYVILGMFFIFGAWGIVRLVSTLSL